MADEIGGGSERAARRLPRLLLALLATVGLLGYGGDRLQRDRELAALLRVVVDGQSTLAYADARIQAAIVYTRPQLFSGTASERVRSSLSDIVEEAAASQQPAVIEVRRDVQRVRVLPWHDDMQLARRDYARYLQFQLDRLRAGAQDVDALLRVYPGLADRLRVAEQRLVEAGVAPERARAVLAARP